MRVYIPSSYYVDAVPNWWINLLVHTKRDLPSLAKELTRFNAVYSYDSSGPDPEKWRRLDFESEQDYTFFVLSWS